MTPLEVEALVLGHDLPTLAELIDRPVWMADALCAGYPLEWWFPERGEDVRPAKEVCGRCVVRAQCLDYALGLPAAADHGIWGGASGQERKRLRRRAA